MIIATYDDTKDHKGANDEVFQPVKKDQVKALPMPVKNTVDGHRVQ
jgi:hypothetical protein